ncbi:ABC transporter permease, partial [Brenneria nigrifluens DSM 30175 = ATCC 13028]
MSDNILGGVATAKPVRRRRSGNWIGFILPLAILSGWQAAS